VDIRGALRAGASVEDLQEILRQAILQKPAGHHLLENISPTARQMSQIGG